MKNQPQPITPAALCARVSSDRQDVDLSVAAQQSSFRQWRRYTAKRPRPVWMWFPANGKYRTGLRPRRMIVNGPVSAPISSIQAYARLIPGALTGNMDPACGGRILYFPGTEGPI